MKHRKAPFNMPEFDPVCYDVQYFCTVIVFTMQLFTHHNDTALFFFSAGLDLMSQYVILRLLNLHHTNKKLLFLLDHLQVGMQTMCKYFMNF